MLPPNTSGTIVERTSPFASATPRQPRKGARGTSQEYLPSAEVVRATFRAVSTE
jgi:hypothetical protein